MTEVQVKPPCRWHDPAFTDRVFEVRDIGLGIFSNTNLVDSGEVGSPDLLNAGKFFRVSAPDTSKYPSLGNWLHKGGLVEHSDFSVEIAFQLATAINSTISAGLNPFAHGAALYLHDLGRTTTHSFMETDVMTDNLWKMIGLRQDIHKLTHSASLYWDDDEIPPENMTIAQKISIVADTAGKRSSLDDSRLRLVDEIIPAVHEGKKKYLNKSNPTVYERQMVQRMPQYTRRENAAISYTLSWFAGLGINLNAIIQAIPLERLI